MKTAGAQSDLARTTTDLEHSDCFNRAESQQDCAEVKRRVWVVILNL